MTSEDIRQQITSAATAAGVSPSLALAVAQQESGFSQNAKSSAGAIGIFQLLPSTAADLGVDPNDPSQNIQGGVAYLKQQLDAFGGNTALALAAYNAGPGNVQKYGGIPPFAETQSYVASILASVGLTPVGNPGPTDGADYSAGSTDGTGYAASSAAIDPISLSVAAIAGLGILWVAFR